MKVKNYHYKNVKSGLLEFGVDLATVSMVIGGGGSIWSLIVLQDAEKQLCLNALHKDIG